MKESIAALKSKTFDMLKHSSMEEFLVDLWSVEAHALSAEALKHKSVELWRLEELKR